MSELKTLKDLNSISDITNKDWVTRTELKEEAKKYLKDLDEHHSKTHPGETHELTEGEMARIIIEKTQDFIRHFFNIEDGLK